MLVSNKYLSTNEFKIVLIPHKDIIYKFPPQNTQMVNLKDSQSYIN